MGLGLKFSTPAFPEKAEKRGVLFTYSDFVINANAATIKIITPNATSTQNRY
jgi:hypothetical protein